MKMKKYVLGAMLLLAGAACFASGGSDREDDDFRDHSADNASKSGLGFAVSAAVEFGGDSADSVLLCDSSGQNCSYHSVSTGQGLTFSVGGHYKFASLPLDIMATVGYKYVTTPASNANIYIGRVVPALQFSYWFTDSWWMGVGPVWHLNNAFHAARNVTGLDSQKYDPALGVNLEAGWKFVALTYTNINYNYLDANDGEKKKLNASNFGVMLIGRF
ncbi:MAG TPA: hypothetical protein VG962_15445 [Steroidobacteraceae bacterium]|nr:hypothetical protein [Steroidobacteraceae bacterium]